MRKLFYFLTVIFLLSSTQNCKKEEDLGIPSFFKGKEYRFNMQMMSAEARVWGDVSGNLILLFQDNDILFTYDDSFKNFSYNAGFNDKIPSASSVELDNALTNAHRETLDSIVSIQANFQSKTPISTWRNSFSTGEFDLDRKVLSIETISNINYSVSMINPSQTYTNEKGEEKTGSLSFHIHLNYDFNQEKPEINFFFKEAETDKYIEHDINVVRTEAQALYIQSKNK